MTIESVEAAARRLSAKPLAQGFRPEALHAYVDAQGQPLYWRIRLKHPTTLKKWIRPLHCTPQGRWVLSEPAWPKGQKPLYRLNQIVQQPTAPVWVVEGEWCADHLSQIDDCVVTTAGGSHQVSSVDWSPLAGRSVIIWPDGDEAGRHYAEAVTTELHTIKAQVQWVDVAALALPAKGDCVDWLKQHSEADADLLAKLPLHTIPSKAVTTQTASRSPKPQAASDFIVNERGVFYQQDETLLWICAKLEITALVRNPASENWGRLLEFADADHTTHRWAMPMTLLKGSGEELRGELLRLGLNLATGIRARHLLLDYITTTTPTQRARCVNQTGWHPPVFILPDCTIGAAQESVIYQTEHPSNPYQAAGQLLDWQQRVAQYCRGNSRLILAIATAFAAALLQPAGVESGGLHLVGESSSGKTTALRVAASVWGAPNYLQRWRATSNGLEGLAATHSDTLLVLDELSQIDPASAGETAYLLANGSGKARAHKNGAVQSRAHWRLLFLSAGELGLTQYLESSRQLTQAGQAVRLVDVPADASQGRGLFEELHGFSSGAALSKALLQGTSLTYGIAARAFLQQITLPDQLSILPQCLHHLSSQWMADYLPSDSSGQVQRVAERFALIAAAGELATDQGITGWVVGETNQAVGNCFSAWLSYRGGVKQQENATFLAHVQAFFEAHGASRFEEINAATPQRVNQRMGFKRTQANERCEYFVLPEMFRREICAQVDPRWAVRQLIDAGLLQLSSEGKAQTTHRLPGEGLKKCYHFTKTAVED